MNGYAGEAFDNEARELLAPSDYVNPEPKKRYHLVVVGAGPAGLITAIGAAGLGADVALIEKGLMGGDCLNVGCVPSKALLEFTAARPDADFAAAFSWAREVRAGIAHHDSVARYSELGVDVFLGEAEFVDGNTVQVQHQKISGRRVAICTGAVADVPPIPGLVECVPLTNETVFDLTEQPQSIAILGGGAIGCELATVFARLGTEVHLFEMAAQVLPLESAQAGERVANSLRQLDVTLHTGAGVEAILSHPAGVTVKTSATETQVQQIVVALGRRPNTRSLQLEQAGVEVDGRGFVLTDNKLRSTNKQVFAAGDCTARLQFTHHADAQARALIQNALFAPTAKVDSLVVPHCTYTHPEVASVGVSEADLASSNTEFDAYEFEFSELDRGRAELDGDGFARVLVAKGSDRILGATIVGHDAGEQIAPICLLMSNGLGLAGAGKALYSYPTRSEYLKRLADAYNRTRMTPLVARLFARWLSFTR